MLLAPMPRKFPRISPFAWPSKSSAEFVAVFSNSGHRYSTRFSVPPTVVFTRALYFPAVSETLVTRKPAGPVEVSTVATVVHVELFGLVCKMHVPRPDFAEYQNESVFAVTKSPAPAPPKVCVMLFARLNDLNHQSGVFGPWLQPVGRSKNPFGSAGKMPLQMQMGSTP